MAEDDFDCMVADNDEQDELRSALAELAATAAENDRLRAALTFYADPLNWGSPAGEQLHEIVEFHTGRLKIAAKAGYRLGPAVDVGFVARAALIEAAAGAADPDPSTVDALSLGG